MRDLYSERFNALFGIEQAEHCKKSSIQNYKNTYLLDRKGTPSRLSVQHKIETSVVLLGQRADDLLHVSSVMNIRISELQALLVQILVTMKERRRLETQLRME